MLDSHSSLLSRTDVPNLLEVFSSREKRGRDTWRIAEVLDVLLDAGQFKLALELADDIVCRLESSETKRLFVAYKKFCELIVFGVVGETIGELDRIHSIIKHGGHSTADKTRASLLMGRALLFCIKVGALPKEEILKARSVLLERLAETSDAHEKALLRLELTKSYLASKEPELRAARGVMMEFEISAGAMGLSHDVQFDVTCLEYLITSLLDGSNPAHELSFRHQFFDASSVTRALQELSIQNAKSEQEIELDMLQGSAELLEHQGFLGAAFEGYYLLAKSFMAKGMNVPALRMAKHALKNAESSGLLYGEVAAKLLLFEIYQLGGMARERDVIAAAIRDEYHSELIVMSQGSAIASVLLESASAERLYHYARKVDDMLCMGAVKSSRMLGLPVIAQTYFHARKWDEARKIWKELAKGERDKGLLLDADVTGVFVIRCWLQILTESSSQAPDALDVIEVELLDLDRRFKHFSPTPKATLGRARVHILLAQVQGLRKAPLVALKHLSVARNLCEQLGSVAELAAVECATGAFLLQVGAGGDSVILESAVLSLRRAEEFYRVAGQVRGRLKALYFLASSAKVLSKSEHGRMRSMRWKKLAMSWIVECDQLYRKSRNKGFSRVECDCFDAIPSISASSIRSFRRSFVDTSRKSPRGDSRDRRRESSRYAGQVVH